MSVRNGNINVKWLNEFRVDTTARFMSEVYAHNLDSSSSGGSYLVLDSSQVSTRSAAEVLSDIGALGTSGTAAAATLLTVTNHATDTTCFPLFTGTATGNINTYTNSSLIYNSNTGALGASSLTTTGDITAVGTVHIDGTSGTSARLEMSEDTDNGTNFIRISAPASCATFGLTLPTGNSTGVMTNDGAGNLSFAKQITFTITSGTDGDYNGDVVYFGGTTSMDVGQLYHYKSDGTWEKADADDNTKCDGLLAVALGAASDTNGMLLKGMVTMDHDVGSVGDVLYVRTSAGAIGPSAPAGNNNIVRIVGYCLDASNGQIWFDPDKTFVEVTA